MGGDTYYQLNTQWTWCSATGVTEEEVKMREESDGELQLVSPDVTQNSKMHVNEKVRP